MFKHILVATEGGEQSREAVVYAVDLAKARQARLTVLTVVQPAKVAVAMGADVPPYVEAAVADRLERLARSAVGFAQTAARNAGIAISTVIIREASPAEAIVRTARTMGCDVIVMASHGRRGSLADLLASETQKTIALSDIPVLVYRSPPAAGTSSIAA